MSKITKVYMISRLSDDNVLEYEGGSHSKVNVKEMIYFVNKEGSNEIKVFIKDGNKTLIKRFFKLMENTQYAFKEELGYTKDWFDDKGRERYATNYYVVSITKNVIDRIRYKNSEYQYEIAERMNQ